MADACSRRSFLARAAGAAACWSAAEPLRPGRADLSRATDDESYWRMVRRQFSFGEARVPMNAANLCPSPRAVAERVTALTADIDVDCSF